MSRSASPSLPSTVSRLAVAVAAACAAPLAFAQSTLPDHVGIYLDNAVVGIGGASYASSGTVSIYSSGGLVTSTVPGDTYGLTSPTSMPLGLTTATLSSIGSNVSTGGHATGEASATADLAGGVLRVSSTSSADVPYQTVGPVAARVIAVALMTDFVTFSVASSAGADIVVTSHMDGFYAPGDPNYYGGGVSMVVNFGGSFTYYTYEDASGYNYGYPGRVIGDFTSYGFTNQSDTGYDFSGILHVTDGEVVPMSVALYLDCSYMTCGFGNTARIGLELPDGVGFTSASGVFLSAVGNPVAAVPEPETWALMLAGLAAAGGLARRRRERMSP